MSDLAYKFAKCCNPIPGNEVAGFISITGGVTIHREDCKNFGALRKSYPYRVIDVRWNNDTSNISEVKFKIIANNELGLLSQISGVIKEMRINILNVNFDTVEDKFIGILVLQVNNVNVVDHIFRKIRAIEGVKEVNRIS